MSKCRKWTKNYYRESEFLFKTFSRYFKIRAKKFHAAKPLAFSLHFMFRHVQNRYSKFTSKIMKMCEQMLKRQRPYTFQIVWIVKILWLVNNQEKANNSLSYRFKAINKHNRLNVGRIALERLVGAPINCSLLQSGGWGREGEPKWD